MSTRRGGFPETLLCTGPGYRSVLAVVFIACPAISLVTEPGLFQASQFIGGQR
ncbi:hypothetical protein IV503_29545 [Klebsiella huaxiensis]|uniref:hypothetical protein n=1 Tax=Klebsiella huaxiensis TaxID=2153354 RepID=UPI002F2F7891